MQNTVSGDVRVSEGDQCQREIGLDSRKVLSVKTPGSAGRGTARKSLSMFNTSRLSDIPEPEREADLEPEVSATLLLDSVEVHDLDSARLREVGVAHHITFLRRSLQETRGKSKRVS